MAFNRRTPMGKTVLAIAALLCAPLVRAATITVNSTADCDTSGCDSGNITLRMAIESVNGGSDVADTTHSGTYGTSDTIQFSYGSYPQTITLGGNPLTVSASVTINGNASAPIVIDANGASGVMAVYPSAPATVNLSYLTLTGGLSSSGGAGLYIDATFGTAAVNMNSSTVSGNTSTGNSFSGGSGGGIIVISTFSSAATLSLFNCTVAGNVAQASVVGPGTDSGNGGGIYNSFYSTLNVVSSTIAGNVVQDGDNPGFGGGIFGRATLENTLVAGNTNGSGTINCSNDVTDNGYNMSDDATCGFSGTGSANSIANLNLDKLNDNGGPTKTIALLPGSAAIDQIGSGTNGCGTTVATDQRGVSRPQNGACDIGAFEVCNTCASSSPRALKQGVLSDIEAIRAGVTDGDDGRKLDDAIKHLTRSLDPFDWIDDSHLRRGHAGESVFLEEKQAADRLRDLIRNNRSGLTSGQLQPLIDSLTAADRALAQTAIDDAIAASGKPADILHAQAELVKGDTAAAAGRPDAIDHYKNAWKAVTH